ncbi:hypothetical protein Aperf_G00000037316 [Anoplocephala perfoliata]
MEFWQLILYIYLQMQSLCHALSTSSVSPATQNFPCRYHRSDMAYCANKHNIARLPDETRSYGFGFGSVDDAEAMCRSKWHLLVKVCISQRVLQRCYEHGASEFQISMWRFVFDSRPNERAANYLCKPHNMKIYRTHREQCYKSHEASASICTQRQSRELARATALLSTQTEDAPSPDNSISGDGRAVDDSTRSSPSASDYIAHIQEQISAAHCETTLEKIRCLTSVLQQNCSQNAIKLIQNYFREMLPPHCYYTTNFEADKGGSRANGPMKSLESAPFMSSFRGSDQTHLLNDANPMETSLTINGETLLSSANHVSIALFRKILTVLTMTVTLLAW